MRGLIKKCIAELAPTHLDLLIKTIDKLLIEKGQLNILDIGGGSGQYWVENDYLIKIIQQKKLRITIFDAQIPSSNEISNLTFQEGFVPDGLVGIAPKTFDLVLAFDLIEHLSRDQGYLMLYEMERISNNFCIIFTPNGFVYQGPEPDNRFNAHISGWTPKDLKQFGYTEFRGHSGHKKLFGVYGIPKWNFSSKLIHKFHVLILQMSRIFVYRFPSKSFAFSGVKNVVFDVKRIELSRINKSKSKDL
jgi:hypothetical protein